MNNRSYRAFLAMLLCFLCYKMFIKTEEEGEIIIKPTSSSRIEMVLSERMEAERMRQQKLDGVTQTCCRKSPIIPTNCYDYCSFSALNTTSIVELAIHASPCQVNREILTAMMSCMTYDYDHSPCCQELSIDKTDAGERCIDFCKGNLQFGPLMDVNYFPCLEMMEPIMYCYKKHALEQL